MTVDPKNITASSPDYFSIGWFRYPVAIEENYMVISDIYNGLMVVSLFLNPVLLAVIIKNPGSTTQTNSSISLAAYCLMNITISCFGVLNFFGDFVSYKLMATVLSMFIPMYYIIMFLLALNTFGVIVKPLTYKTLAPTRPRTVALFLFVTALLMVTIFGVAASFVKDSVEYVKIAMTIVVPLCWLGTLSILAMYIQILATLYRRKRDLERRFNLSNTKQGFLVIKQNTKLAKVLFAYIASMVTFTLPFSTSLILVMYCSQCNLRTAMKFSLYMIPIAMCMPVVHALHWMIFTPQYYKEIKRLARRGLVFCRILSTEWTKLTSLKVRLHTAINRADFVSWWMWFISWCILLPSYIYNMHQDT